jgi:uncharacterized membrane protein YqiK
MADQWQEFPGPGGKVKAVIIAVLIVVVGVLALIGSSLVNIKGDQVGIVEKKFGGGSLPEGRYIAVNGENGIQAQTLSPGWHLFYWRWQYDVKKVPVTKVPEEKVGLIQAEDGKPLPPKTIYAPEWENEEKMLNAEYFLSEGEGYKGPQLTVLKPGKYRLNTELFTVKTVPVTNIEVGTVGVVKSNVGERSAKGTRLVEPGKRGVWNKAYDEGKYYLHTGAYEMTKISTRQVKVSYTTEENKDKWADKVQALNPITVRSKDGFTFPVDVRLTYRIKREDAPKVVATVGDDELVLNKLVTPAVRAIFRNNAEKVKALDYVQNRSKQEEQSEQMLSKELQGDGVTILAVRVGDVGNKETLGDLLKTQTDKEIALQEQETFQEEQRAAEQKKALESTIQEAEEEKRLATANYDVKIAEKEKEQRIIQANAEAEQIKITAQAQAEAYRKISEVIGSENAALIKIIERIAENDINITPEVMVNGSQGQNVSNALMGTMLKDMLNKKGESSENN